MKISNNHLLGLRRLDLNLLLAFDTLLETRSVSETARRLCVGQPAASHILKRLRETFGDDILRRRGMAMEPTPFALELQPRVNAWLEEAQGFLGGATPFDPALTKGVLRVAMSDLMEMVLLPEMLERLLTLAPGIAVEVKNLPMATMESALAEGRIHAALGYFPHLRCPVERQRLFGASVRCFFNHRLLALPSPVPLEALSAHPHVFAMYVGESLDLLDQALRRKGLARRVIASTSSLLALPSILERLPVLAVLPGCFGICMPEGHSSIRSEPILTDSLSIPVDVVWHPQSGQRDLTRFFLDVLWNVIQGMRVRLEA